MNKVRLFLKCFFFLLFLSCSVHNIKKEEEIPPALLSSQHYTKDAFISKMQIKLPENSEFPGSFPLTAYYSKDSELNLSFLSPVNKPLFEIKLKNGKLNIKELEKGKERRAELSKLTKKILGIPLEEDIFMLLFSGKAPLPAFTEVQLEKNGYLLKRKWQKLACVSLDKEGEISRIDYLNKGNTVCSFEVLNKKPLIWQIKDKNYSIRLRMRSIDYL